MFFVVGDFTNDAIAFAKKEGVWLVGNRELLDTYDSFTGVVKPHFGAAATFQGAGQLYIFARRLRGRSDANTPLGQTPRQQSPHTPT